MKNAVSLKFRIVFLSTVICIAFALLVGWEIARFRSALVENHRTQTQVAVDAAVTIVEEHIDEVKRGVHTEEEAKAAAINLLRKIRYRGKEYVWINDMTPRMVMHPFKPELDGKDLSDYADPNGKRLFVAFVETVRKDGAGYVDYMWPKPGEKEPVGKVSYVRLVPEWGWVIGSGVYTDDVAASVGKVVWVTAAAGLVIFVACILFSILLSHRLARPLHHAIVSLTEGTAQMADAANSVASVSQTLADGSSRQAASVEETTAAMHEISSMTRQNSDNAASARQLALRAEEEVEKANGSMSSVVSQMTEIATIGQEVGKIIKTIDEIAFQTNLLALNAAVEAARAGEAGAGFAVVADEVRNLAGRAAAAAKNTSGLVETTVRKISEGASLVERTNEDFQGVSRAVKKVNGLVGEISAATTEQDRGIAEIGGNLTEIDHVTQENAGNAEEIAATSEQLAAQATSLDDVVRDLRTLIEGGVRGEDGTVPAAARERVEATSYRRTAPKKAARVASGRKNRRAVAAIDAGLDG
jgi:methyl-accepting chemotaxis protein